MHEREHAGLRGLPVARARHGEDERHLPVLVRHAPQGLGEVERLPAGDVDEVGLGLGRGQFRGVSEECPEGLPHVDAVNCQRAVRVH